MEEKEMTYQEVMDYVEQLNGLGSVPGLENIIGLCEKMGNPQEELSFVHIAGTNGKGSTLAFLSQILKEAGYRTGRYISPTLFEYRERIQVNNRPISKKALCKYMTQLKRACEELTAEGKAHPTAFEVETALAFCCFKEQKCEIVVLETGMGGLLDATNLIRNTLVSVITSISRDHMGVLGKTLGEIAENKAGIIKKGCEAVVMEGALEVMDVIKARAGKMSAGLTIVKREEIREGKSSLEKQTFSYGGFKDLGISMAGKYQPENAALAIAAAKCLEKKGYQIPGKAIYAGLKQAQWPGRFQVLCKKPWIVADGAHNADGAKRLAQSVGFYFTNRRIIYIIGILRDKEQEEILKATCLLAEQVLTVSTKGARGLGAYELAQTAGQYHDKVTAVDSVQEAVELSLLMADKDTAIIAFGSLSYLGELIRTVEKMTAAKNKEYIRRDSHGKQR